MARLITRRLNPTPKSGRPHSSHYSYSGTGEESSVAIHTVGKAIGLVTNMYGKILKNPVASRITNGLLQYGWRAALFTNRAKITHQYGPVADTKTLAKENPVANSPFLLVPQEYRSTYLHVYLKGKYDNEVGKNIRALRRDSYGHNVQSTVDYSFPESYDRTSLISPSFNAAAEKRNQVIIYNVTSEATGTIDFITLQNRPTELEFKPETRWADIKSMGRNNPMYHYLGGEDTLQINTSWWMPGKIGEENFNPYWVINQCRKFESWSKSNGYVSAPPILTIQWGNSNLFENDYWILTSASYHLSTFNDRTIIIPRRGEKNHAALDGTTWINLEEAPEVINAGLVPFTATQELIFKRVSSYNLFKADIAKFQEPEKS